MLNKIFSLIALILAVNAGAASEPKPPIKFPLELEKDGYVTLVIEDSTGKRVRNLVSETFYKAGKHTIYWDGMDDHGRANIGPHGNYTTTGSIVTPGKYKVRGITHDKVDLVYEFSPYNPNNPPWRTADASGQWLADHTPPSSVLYVPGTKPFMLMGSSLAEGAHGLVWTDTKGKKIRGVQGIGHGWAGAVRLTLDKAGQPAKFIAYGLGASRHGEISLVGIGKKSNKVLFARKEKIKHQKSHYIVDYPVGGLAVYKGLAAISYPEKNEIVFIKIGSGKTLKAPSFTVSATNPKGLAFDNKGRLLVLEGKQLTRYQVAGNKLQNKDTLIKSGLDDPQEIILSKDGKIFISDHGSSHQVKVFSANGRKLYTIGKAGRPVCGPYNEEKMHYPMGMTLTPAGELWVAEEDYQPKRVSVWTKDGKFKKAFYGQVEYGGGGKIDPKDKTRFYYFGMEFKLDWEKGTDKITNIFYRRDNPKNIHFSNYHGSDLAGNPETPIYINGRQYMTNVYTGYPTRGPVTAAIWLMEDGIAKPVAALGQANFEAFFRTEAYKDKIPAGHDINVPRNQQWRSDRKPPYENAVIYAWSDLNDDQEIQVDEVQFKAGKVGGLNQDEQLNFYTGDALKIAVSKIDNKGVPHYDLKGAQRISPLGIPIPYTVVIPGEKGDFAVNGFAKVEPNGKAYGSVSGITKDGKRWYYPSQWTGLHASQSYPINRKPQPGDIIGTTKVISPSFKVGNEELWALNANSGQIYLFTIDGFFVASLFKHGYFAKPNPPKAERGMLMNDYTSDGEGFWQTITAVDDGQVYVQAMNHTNSIMRLDGINSIKRLDDYTVNVSKKQLDECLEWFSKAEMARQLKQGKKKTKVKITTQAPVVDGDLSDWIGADWLEIDDRTWGSFKIANGKLYAAWKTLHKNLIKNSGADPWQGMFKTGGALDIMISTTGNSKRNPIPGDQRLLVSKVNGKIRAVHYEQRSNRKGHPGEIASPNRTVKFDYIADVSDKIQLAEGRGKVPYHDTNVVFGTKIQMRNGYSYELAIPLELIDLKAVPGKITGDIGVLLGNGTATIKRLFWSNKNTVMLFDAPEESLLKPGLWGELKLLKHKVLSFEQVLEERGDQVEVLSKGMGSFNVESSKVKLSEPSAIINWGGKGTISNRAIGRGGYIVFRYKAKGWFQSDSPLKNLAKTFTFNTHNPARFKDGLYAGTRSKVLKMSIDGDSCAGPQRIYGATLWGKQKKVQSASWDIKVKDNKIHQLTLILGNGAKEAFYLTPLAQPGKKRKLVELDGQQGMSVVQFNFKGGVRLTLEQPPYTDEEIKKRRKPANITAIFID